MHEYSESPPPLQRSPSLSDRGPSSRESTPVSTPIAFAPSIARRSGSKDSALPWFKRPLKKAPSTATLFVDDSLLEPHFESESSPLFGTSPIPQTMAGAAFPIDIARHASTSPRDHKSNLTSALQGAQGANNSNNGMCSNSGLLDAPMHRTDSRSESISNGLPSWANGSNPISMGKSDRNRRESLAASMTGGMSWGGISVGSFIRDDMIMTGTSPFTFQSPSYHSSSYLPKLEANFMRDFSCCGQTLPSLHDLLQHYEEAHAEKPPPTVRAGQPPAIPDSRAAIATNAAAAVQQQAQRQEAQSQATPSAPSTPRQQFGQPIMPKPTGFQSTQLQTIPDMDTVEDMEMDDAMLDGDATTPPANGYQGGQGQNSSQSGFGQTNQPRITPLNVSMMQGQSGLRSSQPSTPIAPGRPLQNNPTVSSVNTPTLMANPMQHQLQQQQYQHTPDSSAPGTPGEIDESLLGAMGDMNMQNNPLLMGGQNFGLGNFGMNNDMLDLCIDEPAKRLFSPTGGAGGFNNQQQYNQFRLGNGQYSANSDIARRIREQQMAAGLPDTTTNIAPHEEPKPFRCPVIGCEKAYKNQNGLKYHKAHGHNNQRLHDNADGTFSIVDPETSQPFPGTMGMEKEKPYKCETCGKRYKNLNGLKYHKAHSPPCNPELQGQVQRPPGMPGIMPAQTINPSTGMAP